MYTFLTYFVSLIVIMISVFITLFFKNELERMFGEKKDVLAFHICNVIIILMVSYGAQAVMTIYVAGKEFNYLLQFVLLLFMSLPIYFLGHRAFEKYNSVYRKYEPAENGKVIVLNEKYLKKKKLPSKLRNYNEVFKEK